MRLEMVAGTRGDYTLDPVQIGPVVYVTGPNGSGKTTLLDLIRIAVNGPARDRVPSVVRTELRYDGMTIARTANGDGHHVHVTARGAPSATKAKEAAQLIAMKLGAAWTWDVRAVIAATPENRRKAFLPILGSSLTVSHVREALEAAGCGWKALPEEAQFPQLKRKVTGELLRLPEQSGADFCAGWMAMLRECRNTVQHETESARAAIATAEDRVKRAGALPGARDAWTAKLEAIRARVLDLEREVAANDSTGTAAARDALQAAHSAAVKAYSDAKRIADQRPQAEAHARKCAAAHAAAKTAWSETVVAQTAARQKLDGARDTEQRARAAARDAARSEDEAGAVADLREHLEPILAWIAVVDERDPEAVPDEVLIRREHLATLLASGGDGIVSNLKLLQADADGAAGMVHAATSALQRATEAVTRAQVALGTATTTLEAAQAGLATCTEAEAQLPALAAAVEAATANLAAVPEPSTAARATLDAARAEEESAAATLKAIEDYEAITADRDRSVVRAGRMAEVRKLVTEIEQRAEAVVAELYQVAVRPLVEPASAITRPVLGGSVTLDPVDGWRIGLDGVPVEHLEESAAMVLGIALHAAVMLLQDGWRAVLLDGAEAIEAPRRGPLLAALAAAGFDNVIVCGVADGFTPGPETEVVHLKRAERVGRAA